MKSHLISLNGKPERRKRVEKILSKYHIDYQSHIFDGMKDVIKGCRESHLSIYQYAQNNDLPYILVLEDNIIDTSNTKYFHPHIENIKEFIKDNNFDLIYISAFFTPFKSTYLKKKKDFYLLPQKHIVGGMGYIISKKCYTDILSKNYTSAIDRIHSYYSLRYICRPLMFHHTHHSNSITNSHMNNLREWYFHPKVYNTTEYLYFNGWWGCVCYLILLSIGGILIYLILRL